MEEKIRFIKLPVKFVDYTEEELKHNKFLYGNDWEPEAEEGFRYYNLDQIIGFNEDENGNTSLITTNGFITIYLAFEKFLKLPYFKIIE